MRIEMAYTQERLSHAYTVFRKSAAYQQKREQRALDEQNRKYRLRNPAPILTVSRPLLWNDKDDSGDYDPSAKRKRFKSRDGEENPKAKPPRSKRKADEEQDEAEGNEGDKTERKRPKSTTYAQGRRNGRVLIVKLSLTSKKGRDLLVKLSDEHGTGSSHPREAHINIYRDGNSLCPVFPKDSQWQSTWAKDGGRFNPQLRTPFNLPVPFSTARETGESSSDMDPETDVGELGLHNKKVPRELVRSLIKKRKNECKGGRELKGSCQHKGQERNQDAEIRTKRKETCLSAHSTEDQGGLEPVPPNEHASSNDSFELKGSHGRRSLNSAITSDFYSPPKSMGNLLEKLSLKTKSLDSIKSPSINRGDRPTRAISISSSDSVDGMNNESRPSEILKNGPSVRSVHTFSNTDGYAAPSYPPNNRSIFETPVGRRSSIFSARATSLSNNSSLPSQTQTRFITTNWTHPISFHSRASTTNKPPKTCHFCDDFRYGIYGCGSLENVEVAIDPTTQKIAFEVSGGHVGLGKEPTRMCASCACKRLLIGHCPGNRHKMAKMDTDLNGPDAGLAMKRYINALLDRSPTRTRFPEFSTCHLCFAPATQRCCVRQEKDLLGRPLGNKVVSGCGLVLCQTCAVDKDDVGWVKENMEAWVSGRNGGKAKMRADSEFVWRGSALHAAWGMGGGTT